MSRPVEVTPELLSGFLDEAPEYLEMLDSGLMNFESRASGGLLSLDESTDKDRMNEMFRAAHSLKGLAAALGFDKIKEVTHRMETLFDQVRMRKRDLSTSSFETLFRVVDQLRALVQELAQDAGEHVPIDGILTELDGVLNGSAEITHSPLNSSELETILNSEPASKAAESMVESCGQLALDPELTSLFVETTMESLEELSEGLLALESAPTDIDLLNGVFRNAHNIKGASGAAGLTRMNQLTHNMETVFDHLRHKRLAIEDDLMGALLSSVDTIRAVMDSIRTGRIVDVRAGLTGDHLRRWTDAEMGHEVSPAVVSAPTELSMNSSPVETKPVAATRLNGGDGGTMFHVRVVFPDGLEESAIQTYLITNKLNDVAKVISSDPPLESIAGDTTVKNVNLIIRTDRAASSLQQLISVYSTESVTVTPSDEQQAAGIVTVPATAIQGAIADLASIPPESKTAPGKPDSPKATVSCGVSPAPKVAPRVVENPSTATVRSEPAAAERPESVSKPVETLRVDQEKLDQLMNLGGELVINRARFHSVHGRFRTVFDGRNYGYLVDDINQRLSKLDERLQLLADGNGMNRRVHELTTEVRSLSQDFSSIRSLTHRVHDLRTSMHDFDEALHALNRVSDGIQKQIMGTRMVPIGPTFNRFKRVVRDIAKSSGKQIDLVLKGESTELDKRMIDELADPLTHMVRNSVDHGLEMPDVRFANGKNPIGTVTLEASHRGNSICIEVSDDGAGVSIDRVKAKAIEKGLTTEALLAKMSDREIVQFILQPGFSTAQKVTDLSGRGMGMDIVKSKIEKLSGTVEIDTTPGKGARITIKLPLTLAILTSMVARIGHGNYAVPLETVAEIIKVRQADFQFIHKRRVVLVRDRIVPVVTFEEAFATSLEELTTRTRNESEQTLVIVGLDNEQLGLVVDELLGQEDVVIKSIAENYRNVRGVAGASIRGDGTVSLILDVGALIEMASRAATHASIAAEEAQELAGV